MTALIAKYNVYRRPIAARGGRPHNRSPDTGDNPASQRADDCESTMGRLIADAQLASTQTDAAAGR